MHKLNVVPAILMIELMLKVFKMKVLLKNHLNLLLSMIPENEVSQMKPDSMSALDGQILVIKIL